MSVPAQTSSRSHTQASQGQHRGSLLPWICSVKQLPAPRSRWEYNQTKTCFPRAAHKLWATQMDKGSIQPEGTQQRNVKRAAKPPKAT